MSAPAKNEDLHGNAPDKSSVALLLIDVVNDFDFDEGPVLVKRAVRAAERIAALKQRARQAGVPAIYVNDNFGKWRSDQRRIVEHALQGCGPEVIERLLPSDDDYFVVKPKHSGFFSTTLDLLLDYLQARTLILTGFATDICVLFTANDAYMRDLHLYVPEDCVAAADEKGHEFALGHMRRLMRADTTPSAELDLEALIGGAPSAAV